MNSYKVKIIQVGYSESLGPNRFRADGTITLITGPNNIIFDTGLPKDKNTILNFLKKEGLSTKDINYVICSHGHSDHIGNNNLFPNATFIVSYDICKDDIYIFHDFPSGIPYKIDEYLEVIATPGHSSQDVSLIVKTSKGVIAIVGDLFENVEDLFNDNLWKIFSEQPKIHAENRNRIIKLADYIVPGHGDMFKVPNKLK